MSEIIRSPHDAVWHGQVVEFAIWSQILRQTKGAAHVFLPLSDRGVDGIVHLPIAERFIAVQVKGRSGFNATHEIIVDMRGEELADPDVQIVVAHFDVESLQLSPTIFVFSAKDFLELSSSTVGKRGLYYRRVVIPAGPTSPRPWAKFAIPLTELAQSLICPPNDLALTEIGKESLPFHATTTGFRGEAEFVRRCVDSNALNVFRAFPDTEFVEYVVRHMSTYKMIGVQVKCGHVTHNKNDTGFHVPRHTLIPADNSYLVGLVEVAPNVIHSKCLIIPSKSIHKLASFSDNKWYIDFSPDAAKRTKLDQFRIPTTELGEHLERLVS